MTGTPHALHASLRLVSDHARRLRDRRRLRHDAAAGARDGAVTPARRSLGAALAAILVAQCAPPAASAESVVKLPAAAVDPAVKGKRATAVLAGGCFWGVEGV